MAQKYTKENQKAEKVEKFFQAVKSLSHNVPKTTHDAFVSTFFDMVYDVEWDNVHGRIFRPLDIVLNHTNDDPYVRILLTIAHDTISGLKTNNETFDEQCTTYSDELDEVKEKNEALEKEVASLKDQLQKYENRPTLRFPSCT